MRRCDSCEVQGCGTEARVTDRVSLLRFPKTEGLLSEWLKFVRRQRQSWKGPLRSSRICSLHFKNADFENYEQYRAGFSRRLVLKADAVPSIYTQRECEVEQQHAQTASAATAVSFDSSLITERLKPDSVPSCPITDQKPTSAPMKPPTFKIVQVLNVNSSPPSAQQVFPVAAPTGCVKKNPGTMKVAIEVTGKRSAKQIKRRKYTKNSKTKVSERRRSAIVVKQRQTSVTIKLIGKVAENWKLQREDWTDAGFIQYLLLIRKKYEQLKENCTCKCDEIVRKEPDIETEEDETDSEEEDELSEDSGGEQQSKDDKDWLETKEGLESVAARSVSSDDYDVSECSDDDYGPDGKKIKNKPLFEENKECWVCDHVSENILQKRVHVMDKHCVLYIDCKKCEKPPTIHENHVRRITPDTVILDEYLPHLQMTHGVTDYECPFCSRVKLEDPESYRQHVFTKHSKYLLCQCKLCMESQSTNTDRLLKSSCLKRHFCVRHCDKEGTVAQKVPCKVCGMPVKAIYMCRHVQEKHGEKPKPSKLCNLCGKYFSCLSRHKINVHKSKDQWKFRCSKCEKRFPNKWNLRIHFRLHTGEKPYVCEICGKSFHQNVELRLHKENNHGAPKKNQRGRKRKKGNGELTVNPEPETGQQRDLGVQDCPAPEDQI